MPDTTALQQQTNVYFAPTFPSGLTDTLPAASQTKQKQLSDYPAIAIEKGNEPETYNPTPVRSSWILLLLIVSFLLVSFCYRKGAKYFNAMLTNTWTVKRHKNHLDDHTSSETSTMIAMIIQTIIMEGLIIYCALEHYSISLPAASQASKIALSISAAGAYYIAQLLLIRIIGYVFAKKYDTELWIKGFNASQSLMGQFLAPITIIVLFAPYYNGLMLTLALFLYIVARLAFLIKSFRIFFSENFHYFYFILYLCSVEISPLMLIYDFCIKNT